MFYYTAFGLRIASEIEFPELYSVETAQPYDVEIKLGITPKILENSHSQSSNLFISPTGFLYHIDRVGSYYASEGRQVIVEPYPDASEKSIRIYLLSNAMAAIIYQRGQLPLHASGFILPNGKVALLVGDSGAGKSTTIRALIDKGYPIFTDDVCVINFNESKIRGIPSYPMMKLWENSLNLLNLEKGKVSDRIWQDWDKFGVMFHEQFTHCWKNVTLLIVLEATPICTQVEVKRIGSIEAFEYIGRNAYRTEYIEPMRKNVFHFKITNALINQCAVFKVSRPESTNSLSKIISIIEEVINQP